MAFIELADKRKPLTSLFLTSLLASGMAYRFKDFAVDDFFITYRYARNLASGAGLVFNSGERVFGITCPGYGLILALCRFLSSWSLPVVGTVVTLAALVAITAIVDIDFHRLNRLPEATLASLLLCTSTFIWLHNGSESYVAIALLLLASMLAPGRPLIAGLVSGFAIWCRPDVFLGVCMLGVVLLVQKRRRAGFHFGLSSLTTALIGVILARIWFGGFLPQTLFAKQLQARWLPQIWPSGLSFWPAFARYLETFFIGRATWIVVVGGVIGMIQLFRIGGIAWRTLCLWAIGLVLVYPILGVGMYPWYGLPVLIALIIGFGFAVGWLARLVMNVFRRRSIGRAVAGVLAATILFPVLVMSGIRTWNVYRDGIAPIHLTIYQVAASWLKDHVQPGEPIAAIEVGAIGYYSDLEIYDLLGLVSPRALPEIAKGDLAGSFRQGDPDYFIYYSPHANLLRPITESPDFAQEYSACTSFNQPTSSEVLTVYCRSRSEARDPSAQ